MYPTLSHLFQALFGIGFIPLPTFGFFVAMSFLSAAYFFGRELKRKENEGFIHSSYQDIVKGKPASTGELLSSALFGFILGFKLVFIVMNFSMFREDPRALILSSEGNWPAGILFAIGFALKLYLDKKKSALDTPETIREKVHPNDLVSNMTVIAAITGIIGARLFHILENWSDFEKDPSGMLLSTGGFTFYGGLIFGAAGVIWYARKHKIPTLHLIDACAPGLMLAYGLGRMGCQLSGDGDWGVNNVHPTPSWLPEWLWHSTYPHNVINEGIPIQGCLGNYCSVLPFPVYPTPLYEAIIGIGLFLFLWSIRKSIRIPGQLFMIYLFFNGLERFFIEKIRINTVYQIGNFQITQAEIISFVLILIGITGFFYLQKKKKSIRYEPERVG